MKNILFLFPMLLNFSFFSTAQTTLQGKVTAGDSGEDFINANIRIEKNNTLIATVNTDFNGNYSVHIDAGIYDLTASYPGYPGNLVRGVIVKSCQANKCDIKISTNGPNDEIVVSEYKVPLIVVNNTSCCISSHEIRNLPTRNVVPISQKATLFGKITDSNSCKTLVGANVTVYKKGKFFTGIPTDLDGNYTLRLDTGSYEIRVSYIGYSDQEVKDVVLISGELKKLNFQLDSGVFLDEVVVTEYGTKCFTSSYSYCSATISAGNSNGVFGSGMRKTTIVDTRSKTEVCAEELTIRGSRVNSSDYYIDGIRVRSKLVNQTDYFLNGTEAAFENGDPAEIESIEFKNEPSSTFNRKKERTIEPKKKEPEKARILTAGEWNGLEDWGFWENLLKTQDMPHQQTWQVFPSQSFFVEVVNPAEIALPDCTVKLLDKAGTVIWQTKTDNKGKAVLWVNLFGGEESRDLKIVAEYQGVVSKTIKAVPQNIANNRLLLPIACKPLNNLDIAFVVDATGSMSDEINYLKAELSDVIGQVQQNNENLAIRTGSVFYRDRNDEYITQTTPLSENLNKTVEFIGKQNAAGGGDFPEAVDAALEEALNMQWSEIAIARILFLVLDAPPHGQPEVVEKLQTQIRKAAEMGIRIIPIAASGIDQSTEFLMKSFAISTNGTYVFITDHSGVGNPHLEATVSAYEVEMLNDLMRRLIDEFSTQTDCNSLLQIQKLAVADGVDPSSPQSNYLNQMIYFYPNPAEDLVFIELKEEFSQIRLVSTMGKTVKTINYPKAGVSRIDLSDLPAGAYFLQFQKGNEVITKRLIVAKS